MIFKGIVFDFNGVLWWDDHLQEKSWRQFSVQFRRMPLSDEEMAIHVHGRYNRHTLEYLMGHSLNGDQIQQLTEQKERIYRQLCLDQGPDFQLSPGAIELLDFLVDHRIPHTIATGSGRPNIDFFVEHLSLDKWFEIDRIVCDDGNRPGKPAPDVYLQAAGNLGLHPGSCVVVEDSRPGIQAAYAAGIGYIVALGPAEAHRHLAQLRGVNEAIENLHQFPRRLFL